MYLVTGHFMFQPEALERAQEIMNRIIERGRTEEGIVRYSFYADPAQDTRYFLFEEWTTKEAHDAHFNSDFMQGIVPELLACLAEDMEVKYYQGEIVGSM